VSLSGVLRSFPEVDRAEWAGLRDAREMLVPGQVPFLDLLGALLGPDASPAADGPP
jgi:predicted NUDIX family NTP pyrophosphohydrolase